MRPSPKEGRVRYVDKCKNSARTLASRRALLIGALAQPLLVTRDTLPHAAALAAAAPAPLRDVNSLRDVVQSTLAVADDGRTPLELALRPSYSIETRDVLYPEWFVGRWKVKSTLCQVLAPAGDFFFSPGRNGTAALRRARLEMSAPPLEYECRWRREPDGSVVVDRGYNVASISKAALGARAVQDVAEDGADHVTLVIAPGGAPKGLLYRCDLRVVARHSEATGEATCAAASARCRFDCAETVRQTITVVPGEAVSVGTQPPAVKEVETICLYESRPDGSINGYQRTSTFLVPDAAYTAESPLVEQQAARMLRARDGRMVATDVRTYMLEYTRA
uniref:DUF6816 domain-containing protein n=1 Tax=Calcidiscus leptoporus TaxID=127549 RepID=A0A7S0JG56_9EUKA